jgi:hypothetical protein
MIHFLYTDEEQIGYKFIAIKPKPLSIVEQLASEHECAICLQLMHQPVQLAPCGHTFCGGCMSEFLEKKKECPMCQSKITSIAQNLNAKNTIQIIVSNGGLKRSQAELSALEKKNKFDSNVFYIN